MRKFDGNSTNCILSLLFSDEHIAPAGEEEGELGEYRCKLQRFLQTSTAYSPEKLLVQLRRNCMLYCYSSHYLFYIEFYRYSINYLPKCLVFMIDY